MLFSQAWRSWRRAKTVAVLAAAALGPSAVRAAPLAGELSVFTEKYCASCHNDVDKEGGFDLTSLAFSPTEFSALGAGARSVAGRRDAAERKEEAAYGD